MKGRRVASIVISSALLLSLLLLSVTPVHAQQVWCAAAPGALGGAYITVNADQAFANVREGPNSYLYGKPGILYPGESAPAVGISAGGDWIQISCFGLPGDVGWVYSANVTLTAAASLHVVFPPVSPTPLVTNTFDPTLAAVFSTQATPTRLPTFTPAAAPAIPSFTDSPPLKAGGFTGPVIFGLAVFGILLLAYSFLSRR